MKQSSSVPLLPVSLEEAYSAVTAATSQDPTQVKNATPRLKEIFERPGALDCLHEIAIQKTVPLQVRQQSIIQVKNNIGRWRYARFVSDEDRVRIRARTWVFLDEEDDIIFNLHKVIMTKIARTDYPRNWASLLPDLLVSVNQGFDSCYGNQTGEKPQLLRLRRSLQVLNATIKELAASKIGLGLQTFSSITDQLHVVLFNYYSNIAPIITASLTPATLGLPRTTDDIIIGHLVYKCLFKVSSWVWPKLQHKDYSKYQTWFEEVFKSSAYQIQVFSERRIEVTTSMLASGSVDPGVSASISKLTRHVRVFGKFFRRIQQLGNKQFVMLPMCTDTILYYWSKVDQATTVSPDLLNDSDWAVFPIRFLVQAMVLFRESLAQWTPTRKDGISNENTLTKEFVDQAVKLLVTRFIPLTPNDLDKWMEDPEDWMNREENENTYWEFELRPCAERVLLTLSSQYKDYVTVLLKAMFDEVVGRAAVDLPEIIAKEAVYCSIGRCCLRLKDVIPFEQCLENTFVAEAQNPSQNYLIIKRRIAWLIGKWVSDGCYPANNPKIWVILAHFLQDGVGNDLTVRLTAATALRGCIDTLTLDVASFEPFIAAIVPQLVSLISELDSLENKTRVFYCLNIVIQRCEIRILPFVDRIAQEIPQLWSNAADDGDGWLLKDVLVHTVISLIEACKESSSGLVDLVVPLVRECLSPQASLHLDTVGVSLWTTALRNSGPIVNNVNGQSGLFSLIPWLLTLLVNNAELVGSLVNTLESYYILNAELVLQMCAVELLSAYNQSFNISVPVNNKNLVQSLNLLLQLAPAALWGEPLHISGLFATLLNILSEDKLSAHLLAEYIFVFSRMAMADPHIFLQLMSATAASKTVPESQLWETLLDQWWNKFDAMPEPRQRKLTAMGIASLVSTGRPEVLERLPTEISNLWIDVFGEIIEQQKVAPMGTQGSSPILSLYWDHPFSSSLQADIKDTPERARRNIIFDNDPVRTIKLTTFVQDHIRKAEIAVGGPQAFHSLYLSKMDPDLMKQMEASLKDAGNIS